MYYKICKSLPPAASCRRQNALNSFCARAPSRPCSGSSWRSPDPIVGRMGTTYALHTPPLCHFSSSYKYLCDVTGIFLCIYVICAYNFIRTYTLVVHVWPRKCKYIYDTFCNVGNLYYKISWIFPPSAASCRRQNIPNLFCTRAQPRTSLGELTTLPQTPSRMGRGTPLHILLPSMPLAPRLPQLCFVPARLHSPTSPSWKGRGYPSNFHVIIWFLPKTCAMNAIHCRPQHMSIWSQSEQKWRSLPVSNTAQS